MDYLSVTGQIGIFSLMLIITSGDPTLTSMFPIVSHPYAIGSWPSRAPNLPAEHCFLSPFQSLDFCPLGLTCATLPRYTAKPILTVRCACASLPSRLQLPPHPYPHICSLRAMLGPSVGNYNTF